LLLALYCFLFCDWPNFWEDFLKNLGWCFNKVHNEYDYSKIFTEKRQWYYVNIKYNWTLVCFWIYKPNMTNQQSLGDIIWALYILIKALAPLFDPKVTLFKNSSIQILAQLEVMNCVVANALAFISTIRTYLLKY